MKQHGGRVTGCCVVGAERHKLKMLKPHIYYNGESHIFIITEKTRVKGGGKYKVFVL